MARFCFLLLCYFLGAAATDAAKGKKNKGLPGMTPAKKSVLTPAETKELTRRGATLFDATCSKQDFATSEPCRSRAFQVSLKSLDKDARVAKLSEVRSRAPSKPPHRRMPLTHACFIQRTANAKTEDAARSPEEKTARNKVLSRHPTLQCTGSLSCGGLL